MNALGVIYLVTCGLGLGVGAAYALQALLVRRDPALPSIALTSLGFGLFNLGSAFMSAATGARSPPDLAWFVVAGFGLTLVSTFAPVTAWALLDRPLTPLRIGIAAFAGLAGVVRTIDLVAHARRDPGFDWERMNDSPFALPAALVATAIGIVWTVESALAWRAHQRYAGAMTAFGVVAAVIASHGVLVSVGLLLPPPVFGLAAIPFVLFVHLLSSLRFVDAVRTAQVPAGDLGRYQVLHRIGSGGMGDVFLARRRGPAGFFRDVVLKTLQAGSADAEGKERFLAEARLAAQLRHPNIVDVYDLGEQPSGFFIVMERIEGATLSQAIHRSKERGVAVPPDIVAELGTQLCRALDYAHANGVIHRDLKPQNVMVTNTGVAKLIDFGIAQVQALSVSTQGDGAPAPRPGLTSAGALAGTLGYMPPERVAGADSTAATDLFALGVTLYQLLALRSPFPHADMLAFLAAAQSGQYTPLAVVRPDCPPALADAVHQCLLPEASRRPPSAASLNAMLEHALKGTRVDLAAWMGGLFTPEVANAHVPASVQPRTVLEARSEAPTVSRR